jgi:hypothetical protein
VNKKSLHTDLFVNVQSFEGVHACVIRRMQFRCAKFSKLGRKGDRFETSLAKFASCTRPTARVWLAWSMPPRSSSTGRKASGKAAAAEEEEALHGESNDLDEQLDGPAHRPARRSKRPERVQPGSGMASNLRGDSIGSVDVAIRVAQSFFECPAEVAVEFWNVEGRGSCATFALGVACGWKLEHAAP